MSETNKQMWARLGISLETGKKKASSHRSKSKDYTGLLLQQIEQHGLPLPTKEYRFDAARRWRFDLAWVDQNVAVEIHGGVFKQGRHTRGVGFTNDREKMNEAQRIGWKVGEFTPSQINSGYAIRWICNMIQQ